MRKCFYLPLHRSTQRQGDKRSAAADVIASHAPLRGGSHTARQNGPKHYPRGFKGIAIPLARLSPLSFVVQRKMGPPEVAGKVERQVKTCNERWGPRRACRKENARKNAKPKCKEGAAPGQLLPFISQSVHPESSSPSAPSSPRYSYSVSE